MSAVIHLLRANPIPDGVSFADHSMDIASKLQSMIEQHREEIDSNLGNTADTGVKSTSMFPNTKTCVHGASNTRRTLTRKTIKLTKEERTENAVRRSEGGSSPAWRAHRARRLQGDELRLTARRPGRRCCSAARQRANRR